MNDNRITYKNIQNFVFKNLKIIITLITIILILFIGIQLYNYFKEEKIKKTSITFFDTIHQNNDNLNLENLINDENIFSVLSTLKLIQKNNENKNYDYSNELYKELILSSKLDELYKSSIATNASYTLLNASFIENTKKYIIDISFYIDNISDTLESYISIKKELEYLLIVTENDLNNLEYKINSKALKNIMKYLIRI